MENWTKDLKQMALQKKDMQLVNKPIKWCSNEPSGKGKTTTGYHFTPATLV